MSYILERFFGFRIPSTIILRWAVAKCQEGSRMKRAMVQKQTLHFQRENEVQEVSENVRPMVDQWLTNWPRVLDIVRSKCSIKWLTNVEKIGIFEDDEGILPMFGTCRSRVGRKLNCHCHKLCQMALGCGFCIGGERSAQFDSAIKWPNVLRHLAPSRFVLCTFQLKARTVRWWSQVLSCGTNTKAYERYTCWDHHHDRDHYHHHWHTSWCHQPTSFVIDHPSHFVISPVIISWYHHSTDFVPVMWWYQWSKCRL